VKLLKFFYISESVFGISYIWDGNEFFKEFVFFLFLFLELQHGMWSYWAETSAQRRSCLAVLGFGIAAFLEEEDEEKKNLAQGSRTDMMILVSALLAFLKCVLYCDVLLPPS